MSTDETSQMLEMRDQVLAAEHAAEREQLITEAMNRRLDLLQAEAEAKRARKLYDEACARLVPLRTELDQVAA
jgi:hypothetical protein